MAICGVLSGSEGWEDIEEFGHSKADWLKQFLELPNGLPSHDTFRRYLVCWMRQPFKSTLWAG